VTNYAYDDADRVTSVTFPNIGGSRKATSFTYTSTGQISSISYADGLVVSYTYDNFNRLVPSMPVINPGGASLAGNNERANRITSLSATLGADVRAISFTYDAAAQLTAIDWPGTLSSTYQYDGVGRVKTVDHSNGATTIYHQEFVYDAVGNPLQEIVSGTAMLQPAVPATAKGTYNAANQISSWNSKAFTYDADGNLTTIAGNTFSATYTAGNRPSAITQTTGSSTTTTHYTYDGAGLRVKRAVTAGSTTNYFYGPASRLLFTTDDAGVVSARYIWSGATLSAILTGTSLATDLRYTLLDRTGNVAALTDPTGTIVARYGYQPYGGTYRETQPLGGNDINPFTFVGGFGVMDEGNGLFYMKNRFYDSATGRFLQKDPTGFSGGINLYAYAAGNPIGSIDPEGKHPALLLLIPICIAAWNMWSAADHAAKAGQEAAETAEAGNRLIQSTQQTVDDARHLQQTGNWNGNLEDMINQATDRQRTADRLFNGDVPNTVQAARDTTYHGVRTVYHAGKGFTDAFSGITVPTPTDSGEATEQVLEKFTEEARDHAIEHAAGLGDEHDEK
jgi:RHS repeat-associated protein